MRHAWRVITCPARTARGMAKGQRTCLFVCLYVCRGLLIILLSPCPPSQPKSLPSPKPRIELPQYAEPLLTWPFLYALRRDAVQQPCLLAWLHHRTIASKRMTTLFLFSFVSLSCCCHHPGLASPDQNRLSLLSCSTVSTFASLPQGFGLYLNLKLFGELLFLFVYRTLHRARCVAPRQGATLASPSRRTATMPVAAFLEYDGEFNY